jgi:hypothetical protein
MRKRKEENLERKKEEKAGSREGLSHQFGIEIFLFRK